MTVAAVGKVRTKKKRWATEAYVMERASEQTGCRVRPAIAAGEQYQRSRGEGEGGQMMGGGVRCVSEGGPGQVAWVDFDG